MMPVKKEIMLHPIQWIKWKLYLRKVFGQGGTQAVAFRPFLEGRR